LYNSTSIAEPLGSHEKVYPSTLFRSEVGAIEESLREVGYNPYVLCVEQFSPDLIRNISRVSPKFVFNLCEEINGRCEYEMCVAGLLDMMNIPYTGSGPFALGLALNKFHAKQVLRAAGVPAPRGYLHVRGRRVKCRLPFPVIVKPVHEDASLGLNEHSICYDGEHLDRQVEYIHKVYKQGALVEEYIEGREFNVSIIGENEPEVLAVGEIDFSGLPDGVPHIVCYRAKWDEESIFFTGTVPVCPADIPRRTENRIRDIALRSFQAVECRDYARVDLRTDSRGAIYVLEVNPNPDISPNAGFARAARAAGYTYSGIVQRITQFAIERGSKIPAAVYALQ
jgi:D-alanine-D-alanine ligase